MFFWGGGGCIAKLLYLKEIKITVEAWGKLFRREFLGDDPFMPGIYYEDYLFFHRNIFRVRSVCEVQADMYHYTVVPSSIMHSSFSLKKAESYSVLLETLSAFAKTPPDWEAKQLMLKKCRGHIIRRFIHEAESLSANRHDTDEERILLAYLRNTLRIWREKDMFRLSSFKLIHRLALLLLTSTLSDRTVLFFLRII